ncbi:MAG: cation:proton antiporter, partial [Nitrososphaeraceae archaeon]
MAVEIAQIFQDFAVIMIVASVMTLISYKLKQPVIIGYIIAGMIIGPYTPPFSFILNIDILSLFAEIGVVLLLFVVGMEFPIQKLQELGRKILVIGITEAFGTFA